MADPKPQGAKQGQNLSQLDRELAASKADKASKLDWHNPESFGVEGRAWENLKRLRYYDRLPAEAQGKVPSAVWSLSRHSAGIAVRFKTDSTSVHVKYKVSNPTLALPHMPATGVSGVDLYAKDDKGVWRWVNVNKPSSQEMESLLINEIPQVQREYLMYLPLYNGVEYLKIGVDAGASFEGVAPRDLKSSILFYGTSITHGACASRPGMCHPAILGRRLNRPVINLGFSGNGKMDAEVGEFLAKLELGVLVIDCNPNMQPALVRERCVPLVKQVRAAHPNLPIVLVEDRRFTNTWIRPERQKFHDENHAALKEGFDKLKAEGVQGLFYVSGDLLLGEDTEGTTDGSHPNDLGFYRQADVMEPVIREALAWKK